MAIQVNDGSNKPAVYVQLKRAGLKGSSPQGLQPTK